MKKFFFLNEEKPGGKPNEIPVQLAEHNAAIL